MSTSFRRRGVLRALLTGGAVIAVALVPGAAAAADDPLPDPAGTVPEVVDDALEGPTGQGPAGAGGDELAPPAPAADEEEPPDPIGELRALIADIRTQFPENECVDGVAVALEGLLVTIADPAEFEQYQRDLATYLAGLPDVLGSLEPGGTPPSPPPFPEGPSAEEVEAALAELAAALQACVPAPPTEQPEPPAEEPEQPVRPAQPAAPVQQPVSYPGYAPTGAEPAEDGAGTAPAALAGALLLAGGLTVARSRRRSG